MPPAAACWRLRRLIERIGALPVGVTCRSLGPLSMRGKEQPIALYALETA